ncbi:MAG: DUF2934 domain-containing protein [Phycisphaerales bacterium]
MSSHNPSHQYQPQNQPTAAQSPQATPASSTPVAAATKGEACTKASGKCGCGKCQSHIRTRAYEISQARNGGPGNAVSDWSQAEKELSVAAAAKA